MLARHHGARWTCAAGIVAVVAGPARAQSSLSTAMLHDGTLRFVAHATVGEFTGTTTHLSGAVSAGPDLRTAHGWVEAPARTLRTGNGRRDRDTWAVIEANRFPTIRFELASATFSAPLGVDETAAVLHGSFALHGETRPVDVPATVSRVADTLRVVGGFPLNVSTYGVHGLSRMFGVLSVREVVDVHLALRFVITAPPALTLGTRP